MEATTTAHEVPCLIQDKVKGACGIAPETPVPLSKPTTVSVSDATTDADIAHAINAVFAKAPSLWENGSIIAYSFFGGTKYQQEAVAFIAPEWTYYANLTLQRRPNFDESAMIRIDFDPGAGSWSTVGKGALQIKDGRITMNLGWINDSRTVSLSDRGTILHEWGHVLGLMHEHQSPARDGYLTLKRSAVLAYSSKTQGWSESLIQSQILDVYNLIDVSNYSKLDTTSVMMYFMPGSLNEQGEDVEVNNELSDMDKAYMVINYPRNVTHPAAPEWTLGHALGIAGVPENVQKDIVAAGTNLAAARSLFAKWNKEARLKELQNLKASTTPADEGTRLVALLSELASKLLTQHGINPYDGYPSESQHSADPAAPTPQVLPVIGVEHAVWSGIAGVLSHPMFQEAVSGVVRAVLTQLGLGPYGVQQDIWNPPSWLKIPDQPGLSSSYAAQHGLWSGPASVLTTPIFQRMVSGAIDDAFNQRGIRFDASADTQLLLFSDIESILAHPTVRQALGSVVDMALSQRGLTSWNTPQYPNVQRGVFSGLADILKSPAFQRVVMAIIGAALPQRGINPAVSPDLLSNSFLIQALGGLLGAILGGINAKAVAAQSPDIQQGILDVFKVLPGLLDVILSGVNPKIGAVPSSDIQQGILDVFKVLPELLGAVLSGVNPRLASGQASDVQRGIFDVIKILPGLLGAVLSGVNPGMAETQSPAIQQGISDLIKLLPGLLGAVLSGVNPKAAASSSDVQHGITDILKDPRLEKLLTTVLALARRGVKTTAPVDAEQGISDIIKILPGLLGAVLGGVNPGIAEAQSPDIQQGISDLIKLLPGLLGAVLSGVNPKAAASSSDVQHGITDILKDPRLEKLLTAVLALAQHGLTTTAPVDIQQGISDVIKILPGLLGALLSGVNSKRTGVESPDIQQGILDVFKVLLGLLGAVLSGVNPKVGAVPSFDMQRGILDILKDPRLGKVLGVVLDTVPARHGVRTTAPVDAQQGISDIIKILPGLLITALSGVEPRTAAQSLEIQQGILDDLLRFRNPLDDVGFSKFNWGPLEKAINGLLDKVVTQNASKTAVTVGAQRGLFDGVIPRTPGIYDLFDVNSPARSPGTYTSYAQQALQAALSDVVRNQRESSSPKAEALRDLYGGGLDDLLQSRLNHLIIRFAISSSGVTVD